MPTSDDQVLANDEAVLSLETQSEQPDRKPYRVLTGLFKNSQEYGAGSTVMLDDSTAANFIAAGDVEPM